ncbi:50S ribosomal protein L11 methyltransferase [Nitrobacter sp. JJSN]|uniref:50S ribosomal protein L11 methyltransferase n=1 Tax=Nitrobacter sp. JJSN TaxID=3453033 RepID=UPI003F763924
MTNAVTPATSRAAFVIGEERIAKRAVDLLTECLEDGEAAVAAFERSDGRWGVSIHFADPPDEERIRTLVALTAGDDIAQTIAFDTIAAKDWVEASLQGLAPVPAGRFIVHGRHDRARVPPNKLGIEIEAALAFGTGHHGTTRGCLLLLDHVLHSKMPRRVLDLGAGTGVLAIAAAKALRRKVLASDIDPRSTIVARENAALNGVGNLVESICATGFSAPPFRAHAPFDLVLANILANPLRQMAPAMATHLAPEAMVVLSGLLPHQTRGVIAAYRAQGLVLIQQMRIDGWCSLLMQNRR